MSCIFCGSVGPFSEEHIVPESLGNRSYTLPKNSLCSECNNKFSKFEGKALSESIYLMERARMAIPTKRNKPASGVVDGVNIRGDEHLTMGLVTIGNLKEEQIENIDPVTGQMDILIKGFDHTYNAMAKLLLKMGYESLYTSQRKLFLKNDFSGLLDFIFRRDSREWPFISCQFAHQGFTSLPRQMDKVNLKRFRCQLLYKEYNDESLLFKFSYGAVDAIINLISRNSSWIPEYMSLDKFPQLYPKNFRY